MGRINTKRIAACGIVGGLYAALTILTSAFSYGPIQFRLAEALSVLCCFSPPLTVGITLGCLIANLFSTVSALDILVGTGATLLACLTMTKIRSAWLLPLPNVLFNGIIIGAELAWVTTPDAFWAGFLLNGAQVALGELAVMLVLGLPLYFYAQKGKLFRKIL